jgi:hypothetical protein
VTEVEIISGPEMLHESVVTAMKAYRCTSPSDKDIVAEQRFDFSFAP